MEEIGVAVILIAVCFVAMAFAFQHEQRATEDAASVIERNCPAEMAVSDCIAYVRGK